jgi:hypothetical protein
MAIVVKEEKKKGKEERKKILELLSLQRASQNVEKGVDQHT